MLTDWIINHSKNYLVMGIVTFTFPERFIKKIYSRNKGKKPSWMEKKSCLTISFDCDYPEDVEYIPSLLNFFDHTPFKTSIACIGSFIKEYPDIHKMIISQGHEIMNHTYTHPNHENLNPDEKFNELPLNEMIEEVKKCHEVCRNILNYNPVGIRIPHLKNLFTRNIYDFLHEIGYTYSSSTWLTGTSSSGMPFYEKNDLIEFPLCNCPKHPFSVFDTWHFFRSNFIFKIKHRTSKQFLDIFENLIKLGINTNSYINVYFDPRDIESIDGFENFLDMITDKYLQDIEVLTYREIVERIKEHAKKIES